MDLLVGLGSPAAVFLWVAASLVTFVWLLKQARDGAFVTVQTFVVGFWFLLSILLQYPFTFSPANVAATGPSAYVLYTDHVDTALAVSVVGMAAFALGFGLTSKEPRACAPVSALARGLRAWAHPTLLWASSGAVVLLFLLVFGASLLGGEGLRIRALANPVVRPVYNVVASILPLLIATVMLAASERRDRALWTLVAVLLGLAVLTESRAVAFGGLMSFVLARLGYRSLRGELRVRHAAALLPVAALVFFLMFYIADLRDGRPNVAQTALNFGFHLFYGNNFSDLRDFAWVLAYWDGEPFGGRTQLAGLLGFIPSVLSTFRTQWSWGRVSTDMVGVGTREATSAHPGLRPGVFGEVYMNFGVVGVVVGGLVLGYVVARLYAATKDAVERYDPSSAKLIILAAFAALSLLANVYMTGGFAGIYVVVGALILIRIAKGVLRASTSMTPVAGGAAPG
jgi:oligosaccharide repeat unit polymerase